MDPNINFAELRSRVSTWTIDDEEKLLNKLKAFSDGYTRQADDLNKNIQSFTNNLHVINIDYFSAINTLKTLSLKKFFEHVVDKSELRQAEDLPLQQPFLSIEEAQNKLDNKIRSTVGKSIEAITNPLNNNMNENQSNFDDGASEASSKLPKVFDRINRSLKLPYINGTTYFKDSETCGILDNSDDLQKKMNSSSNNQIPNMQEGQEYVILNQKDSQVTGIPSVPGIPSIPQGIPSVPQGIPSVPQESGNVIPQTQVTMSKVSSVGVPLPPPMNFSVKAPQAKVEKKESEEGKMDEEKKIEKKKLQSQQPKPQVEDFQSMLKRMVENRNGGGAQVGEEKKNDPNVPASKNDINLHQFVKPGMFKDEEDEDGKDDIDVGIYNSKSKAKPKEEEKQQEEEQQPTKPGNLFDMKSGNTASQLNKKKQDNFKDTKSKFDKMFGEEDENEEETQEVNKIEKKTNDLAKKLNLMTSKPESKPISQIKKPPENTNTTNEGAGLKTKKSIFLEDDEEKVEAKPQPKNAFEEMKRKLEEKNKVSNPVPIKPSQREVKEEEEAQKTTSSIETKPPVSDFKMKMSGIASMMEGRMGGGMGFGRPANNDGRQEPSQTKNDNEISDKTNIEELMEKKVVVQKKKPMRKGFGNTEQRNSTGPLPSNKKPLTQKGNQNNKPLAKTNNSKPGTNTNTNTQAKTKINTTKTNSNNKPEEVSALKPSQTFTEDMRASTKSTMPQQPQKRLQFLFDEE